MTSCLKSDDSAHLSYRFEYFVELKLKFKDKFCLQLNMPLPRVVSVVFIYYCEYGTIKTDYRLRQNLEKLVKKRSCRFISNMLKHVL